MMDTRPDFARQNMIEALLKKNPQLTPGEIELFLETFDSLVIEAIERDGCVDIEGLGSFSLGAADIADCEGCHIRSLSFSPSPSLRDYVNRPLEHLESVALDGEPADFEKASQESDSSAGFSLPLDRLAAEASGIQTLLDEIAGMTQDKQSEKDCIEATEPQNCERFATTNHNTEPQIKEHERNTGIITDENKEYMNVENNNVDKQRQHESQCDSTFAVDALNRENDREIKGSNAWWIAVVVVLSVVIIALLAYKGYNGFLKDKENGISAEVTDNIDTGSDIFEPEAGTQDSDEFMAEQPELELVDKSSYIYAEGFPDIFNAVRRYDLFLDTATLVNGSRLTMLSLKYYGHKDFWVYIYEANRDIIANPNDIKVNTRLRIPVVNPELIDAANPECIGYARFLHDIYVEK